MNRKKNVKAKSDSKMRKAKKLSQKCNEKKL